MVLLLEETFEGSLPIDDTTLHAGTASGGDEVDMANIAAYFDMQAASPKQAAKNIRAFGWNAGAGAGARFLRFPIAWSTPANIYIRAGVRFAGYAAAKYPGTWQGIAACMGPTRGAVYAPNRLVQLPQLGAPTTDYKMPYIVTNGASGPTALTVSDDHADLALNTWYDMYMRITAGASYLWVDGVLAVTAAGASMSAAEGVWIGAWKSKYSSGFAIEIDHLRADTSPIEGETPPPSPFLAFKLAVA